MEWIPTFLLPLFINFYRQTSIHRSSIYYFFSLLSRIFNHPQNIQPPSTLRKFSSFFIARTFHSVSTDVSARTTTTLFWQPRNLAMEDGYKIRVFSVEGNKIWRTKSSTRSFLFLPSRFRKFRIHSDSKDQRKRRLFKGKKRLENSNDSIKRSYVSSVSLHSIKRSIRSILLWFIPDGTVRWILRLHDPRAY